MIRLYAIAGLVVSLLVGGLGSCVYIEKQKVVTTQLRNENATLTGNVKALEKKIDTDKEVLSKDTARAVEDVKRITKHKEKSREIIQGTKSGDSPALDADATQRVRDIFAIH